jgi:hypothetical protein
MYIGKPVEKRSFESSDIIFVPELLLDQVRRCGFRSERIDTTLLFWWLIDGWSITDGTNDRWKRIHDTNFTGFTKNTNSRSNARKWLSTNGFIKIKMVVCKDGKERPERIKGQKSQSYAITHRSSIVPYRLASQNLATCISTFTANDNASQQTRRVLGLLKRKVEKNGEKTPKVLSFQDNRDLLSIFAIEHNLGSVKRGRLVDRLYSPWTGARKLIRSYFTIEGCEIRSLDLRAAQPMLMALLADDQTMSDACFDDSFYGDLSSALGLPREQAKKRFYHYSFGPNRNPHPTESEAYEVQEWMKSRFPIAANYVFTKKTGNYRKFAREMQNKEALLFIDGIYSEITKSDLPALTVHDAIYFKATDYQQIKQIIDKRLTQHFKNKKFALNNG